MTIARLAGVVCVVALGVTSVRARVDPTFDEHLVSAFTYRNIGPFRMQARIASIAVPTAPVKDHLYTYYVAPWIGGVWKTVNNGTTFEPVFDSQDNLSIGAVTVAPSNANIVWVGTGDAFTSRSSYAGDGIYKSLDAGHSWTRKGLIDTQHIARVIVHPTDPNTVYVAAMGHLYSTNPDRGVYKTTNGGDSWQKVLYVNERVGVVDLVMSPTDPSTLYAATYEKDRLPWQMVNGGPASGIYKTTNAGATWTRLGGGLPTGRIGRIGLAQYPRNANILYAVIENENERVGAAPAPGGRATPTFGGQVYRTEDAGTTWKKMTADDYNVSPKGPYYFSQIFVDPANDQNLFVTQDGFRHSLDGGRTWNAFPVFPRMFGDVRTLWIDPDNPDRMIQGSDGGIAVSYDGGRTSEAYANMPLGSVYALSVDMEDPYNVYAGLQDHENWRGPSNGAGGRITEQDWYAVGDGDGIFTVADPTDSRWLYTTREYGAHERLDQKLGYRTNIQPRAEPGQPPLRFLWEPPVVLSPQQSTVLYAGSQVLLRSEDRGDHWKAISPDLSTHPADKIFPESEGGVPGGIPWFAISTIAESSMRAGVIWAGTSDGNVQVTQDTGRTWTDVTPGLTAAGLRRDAYVSRVVASTHVVGRAYVAKSGYKLDDFRPFLCRTDDFGASWRSIAGNLPNAPINVVVEDRRNPNLLFVGNDVGIYVSIDGGTTWVRMNNNMPTIPIHDLLVHPREQDLVAGSYGRGIFITNIGPLQEMTPAVLAEDVHLFTIKPAVQRVTWSFGANDYLFGQAHLQTPNEPNGMAIRYYLKTASTTGQAVVSVTDSAGKVVAQLPGPASAGINTVIWNMRVASAGRGRGAGAAPAAPGSTVLDQLMPLGDYGIALTVAGQTRTARGTIVKTQGWSIGPSPQVIR